MTTPLKEPITIKLETVEEAVVLFHRLNENETKFWQHYHSESILDVLFHIDRKEILNLFGRISEPLRRQGINPHRPILFIPPTFANRPVQIDGNKITVGCTTGTLEEAEAIVKAAKEKQGEMKQSRPEIYEFEGGRYAKSGEYRLPKKGDVYLSEVNGKPDKAWCDFDIDIRHILRPVYDRQGKFFVETGERRVPVRGEYWLYSANLVGSFETNQRPYPEDNNGIRSILKPLES